MKKQENKNEQRNKNEGNTYRIWRRLWVEVHDIFSNQKWRKPLKIHWNLFFLKEVRLVDLIEKEGSEREKSLCHTRVACVNGFKDGVKWIHTRDVKKGLPVHNAFFRYTTPNRLSFFSFFFSLFFKKIYFINI